MSEPSLARRLGTGDAVVIGLGAMLGAGVFAALAPAAAAAGSLLLAGLTIAAVVATCNALSSAQLAALHPCSGGTYVYGRRQLGPFWGHLAGFGFVVGKTAGCAAMALTVGAYAVPAAARPLAVASVVALTVVNLRGVAKTARLTRILVLLVLLVLALVVLAGLLGGTASAAGLRATGGIGAYDVLQSAGLLCFAFAGYARIATFGEEVRDPERTIARAIPLALGAVLAVYAAVAVSALLAVGPAALESSTAGECRGGRLMVRTDPGRTHRWRRRRARRPAVAAGRGEPDDPRDGPRGRAAALAGRRPPGAPGAAPRRAGRRRRRRRAGAGGRPARGDRLLQLRGARLLRGDQRQRADAAA